MNYPEFLKKNGTIAFAAPSFGAAEEPYRTRMEHALRAFEAMGYRLDVGANAFAGEGVGISNTPEKCAEELAEYYAGHGDVLISVGGGELMCETLEKLDLETIGKAAPKWFLGYSDNTNFGFLLPTMFDTASLYGPCAPAFGMEPLHESLADCLGLLTGETMVSHGYDSWEPLGAHNDANPLAPYHLTEQTQLRFFGWDGSPIEGRFLGGCLDILEILCGTRFDWVEEFNRHYGDEGIIWFLEACDMNAMMIRRSLWHLKHAGWFDRVRAFVFGRPLHIADGADFCGVDEYNAAAAVLGEFGVPIIMDADIGHLPPAMTMINGGYGRLCRYGENNIRIHWELR